MSANTPSRDFTLDDIAAHIKAADLPPLRRGEILSALRTVGRVLGRPLENIPSDPRRLGHLLADVAPAAHDISEGRWANVRSLTGKALEMVRPILPARQEQPLSLTWKALLDRVDPKQRRYALSPGLRWFTSQGIEPVAMTAEALDAFRNVLLEDSLRARPEDAWAGFVTAWNAARLAVEGWPDLSLVKLDRRNAVTLPWEAFPASLQADAEAWLYRQAGHDVMDEDGPPKPLRPATIESYRYLLRSVASAAVAEGIDPQSITSLADLVTVRVFKAALLGQWKRTGRKATTNLAKTASVLISMARYWVRLLDADLKILRDAARKIEPTKRRGLTEKNLTRLRPLDNPRTALSLLNLPFVLRREVERGRLTPRRAAIQAQVAVAIAILLIAPMRLQNLRSLEVHRHLVRHGKSLHLVVPSSEVKNDVDLEFEVEPQTRELLRWYMEEHRPVLAPVGSQALFPGGKSGSKGAVAVRNGIMKAIRKHVGLDINPHLFRHIAAKLFLDRNPGDYETVRRLLGHKSIETTIRFYAGFETKAATKHYQDMVMGLRKAGAAT